jgi:hypothetical protein
LKFPAYAIVVLYPAVKKPVTVRVTLVGLSAGTFIARRENGFHFVVHPESVFWEPVHDYLGEYPGEENWKRYETHALKALSIGS